MTRLTGSTAQAGSPVRAAGAARHPTARSGPTPPIGPLLAVCESACATPRTRSRRTARRGVGRPSREARERERERGRRPPALVVARTRPPAGDHAVAGGALGRRADRRLGGAVGGAVLHLRREPHRLAARGRQVAALGRRDDAVLARDRGDPRARQPPDERRRLQGRRPDRLADRPRRTPGPTRSCCGGSAAASPGGCRSRATRSSTSRAAASRRSTRPGRAAAPD